MESIVLKITGPDFTLAGSPGELHLAFNYVRLAIGRPWKIEIIEYGPDVSFWYNFRAVSDNELLYQIRVLA